MHARSSLTGSPRLTSYASATGLPPPAHLPPPAEPAPAAGAGAVRVPKRAREDDDIGFNAFACYAPPRAARGYRSSPAFERIPRPRPLVERRVRPPDEILATIAAFAAGKKPLAFFNGLRLSLGARTEPPPSAQAHLLRLRPEALLQWPAASRTPAAWRAYFEAGGTLATVPVGERSPPCCEAAIEHTPRALKDVPERWRSLGMCEYAVLHDGYAMESVPRSLLAAGSVHRQTLCDLAYLSPRPPRMRHVPADLLTADRCLRSLRWAPLDLGAVPAELLTTEMCVTAIQSCPPGVVPPTHCMPHHLRTEKVALAMAAHRFWPEFVDQVPSDGWYLPGAITTEVAQARVAHGLRHAPETERLYRIDRAERREGLSFHAWLWGSVHNRRYASKAEAHAARSLAEVPESERTLARWEAAVEADPWSYEHVPPEHQSWPLLSRALRDAPKLLMTVEDTQALLPGGVTEAMCLEAVQRLGLGPSLIPEAIRTRPSFQAAVRALPSLAFNERAFRRTIDGHEEAPTPDALTMEWVERHLQEDPARARYLGWFLKPEWAVAAYRHGGRRPESLCHDIENYEIQVDFIAEICPVTEATGASDRDVKSGSSSSSAAASARRPS